MGQYLTIGLMTSIAIGNRERDYYSATLEEVRDVLQSNYNKSGIYDLKETDRFACLQLKPEIAEAEMISFVDDFYKLRYTEQEREFMFDMNKIKEKSTLAEWLDLAKESCYGSFQLDRYVQMYSPYKRGFRVNYLATNITQIMLSMDGKIVMEEYYGLFGFFTRLVRERLSKYQLANALLVGITG